ncbi:hypothetical protein LY78DRAFT_662698 [Colletotrichum sublineola]|nr:hypothetical protein LY78DRAFT_662698 [Colletotrichum sublineola]
MNEDVGRIIERSGLDPSERYNRRILPREIPTAAASDRQQIRTLLTSNEKKSNLMPFSFLPSFLSFFLFLMTQRTFPEPFPWGGGRGRKRVGPKLGVRSCQLRDCPWVPPPQDRETASLTRNRNRIHPLIYGACKAQVTIIETTLSSSAGTRVGSRRKRKKKKDELTLRSLPKEACHPCLRASRATPEESFAPGAPAGRRRPAGQNPYRSGCFWSVLRRPWLVRSGTTIQWGNKKAEGARTNTHTLARTRKGASYPALRNEVKRRSCSDAVPSVLNQYTRPNSSPNSMGPDRRRTTADSAGEEGPWETDLHSPRHRHVCVILHDVLPPHPRILKPRC